MVKVVSSQETEPLAQVSLARILTNRNMDQKSIRSLKRLLDSGTQGIIVYAAIPLFCIAGTPNCAQTKLNNPDLRSGHSSSLSLVAAGVKNLTLLPIILASGQSFLPACSKGKF